MSSHIPEGLERSFIRNAHTATESGFDLCCSWCGEGLASDDWDDDNNHDYWCPSRTPEFKAEREQQAEEFLARVGRILEEGKG